MRIGILGAGTNAVIAIGCIAEDLPQAEIVCIHDPSIPTFMVGESSSPTIASRLFNALMLDVVEDSKSFDGTPKLNNTYFWQKANDKQFRARYATYGIHLNSVKFGKWALNRAKEVVGDRFTEIQANIHNISQHERGVVVGTSNGTYEFDYVINSLGSPSEEDLNGQLYTKPPFETVNSVILHSDPVHSRDLFTSSIVHDNGWMFGIPLTSRNTFGYMYNNQITSKEDAIENFKTLKKIDESNLKFKSWSQYYKNTVVDGRVVTIGNKLYLFEPHHGLPMHYSMTVVSTFAEKVKQTTTGFAKEGWEMNQHHKMAMQEFMDLIYFCYVGRNKMDSEYWKITKSKATQALQNSPGWTNWCRSVVSDGYFKQFSVHKPSLMRDYVTGFDINLLEFV